MNDKFISDLFESKNFTDLLFEIFVGPIVFTEITYEWTLDNHLAHNLHECFKLTAVAKIIYHCLRLLCGQSEQCIKHLDYETFQTSPCQQKSFLPTFLRLSYNLLYFKILPT